MSSSSTGASSSSSGGSSSSSGCSGECLWRKDVFGQWQNTCFGCDAESFCREPGSIIPVIFRDGEPTPCEPYGDPFPSSSSGGFLPARLMATATVLEGMVRVPSVKDTKVWRTIAVNLSQPWRLLQLPELGWIITILQVPAGPATPLITPAHVPTDVVEPADKSLAASVILPEGGVFHQYWVPVLEKYRWARLETANWTVVFLRMPIPPAP